MPKKILIVDDDEDIRRGLAVRLRASGYAPIFAEDCVGALAIARREIPDLIILDLGLPAGNGFLVLERVGNCPELAGIPVIVLSARDAEANEEKALKAGACAYFQKPVDDSALIYAIDQRVA